MVRFITLLLALLVSVLSSAQSGLFFPRNLQRAYNNGTRSQDGKPGAAYWQNRASYVIDARLEPKKRRISGQANIVYTNNSPDSLKIIRLKLAHDLYRKGGLRDNDVNPADIDDGVTIETLQYNGLAVEAKSRRRHDTFLDILLGANPLLPGANATITVKWSYVMPADKRATRECVCDASTFFVAYWYPQVAVYDDLRGWADAPYNGLQEFYNDFSDYEVRITTPPGYMLWATGEWQNAAEMLNSQYLERYNRAHSDTAVIKVCTEAEMESGTVFKKGARHTFQYKASGVPDFAFAASDHYNWDATSAWADMRNQRRTFVSAAYDTRSKDFQRVARIAADGIQLLSSWLPGYPFPYPAMTVFNGNDGMEYPMMVNDASTSEGFVTSLTVHEVAHSYFPFLMGTNEQEYAWMDEGWASFFDLLLSDSLTGNQGNVRGYSFIAGTDADVPPMVRSRFLSGQAYGNAAYARPQNAYLVLLDVLGYEVFHRCMVEYIDRWKGKHPAPYDFFNTWNEVSGQNLDWIWRPWFFEWGYPDLAVSGVNRDQNAGYDVITIEKIGTLPVPVNVDVAYSDGSRQQLHRSAAVWQSGQNKVMLEGASGKVVSGVSLDTRRVPDTNRKNNSWKKD